MQICKYIRSNAELCRCDLFLINFHCPLLIFLRQLFYVFGCTRLNLEFAFLNHDSILRFVLLCKMYTVSHLRNFINLLIGFYSLIWLEKLLLLLKLIIDLLCWDIWFRFLAFIRREAAYLVFYWNLGLLIKLFVELRLNRKKFSFILLYCNCLQDSECSLKLLLKVEHFIKQLFAVCYVLAALSRHQFVYAVFA